MNAPLRDPNVPTDRDLAAQISLRVARCLGLLNAGLLHPTDSDIHDKLGDEMMQLLKVNQTALETGALSRWQEGTR